MAYEAELSLAIDLAKRAGALLRDELHRTEGPRGREAHADIDEEAEKLIRTELVQKTPYAYRGEETGFGEGQDPSHCWLVDPNDGTLSFLRCHRGAAVSIALLKQGDPVLGVVYSYAFPDDEGDLIAWAEGGRISRNGLAVDAKLDRPTLDRYDSVLVSQAANKKPLANAACVAPARFFGIPSLAYRLALAAVGEGTAAVALTDPHGWDYAAGHAILRAAGGDLFNQDAERVIYSLSGKSESHRCFGGHAEVARELYKRPWDSVFADQPPIEQGPYDLVRPSPRLLVRDAGALRRAQGCLLGQFAGDSLGSLVEFERASIIARKYPQGVCDLADGGVWGTLAGQPTDDSEMALMLARSIVSHGGYDHFGALKGYIHWLFSNPFDIGVTTSTALRAAAGGDAYDDCIGRIAQGANHQSQANGSLMRISPLGILGAGSPQKAVVWARQDSTLTHPNPVCREACAAFVAAIAAAIGQGADAKATYQAACDEATRGGESTMIGALKRAQNEVPQDFSHQQGWVLIALQNAFYQLLHAPSFEDGVIRTVMLGGDTDTNAAIAGALLGAVHGREAVPARWRNLVLTCRPMRQAGAYQPRPVEMWPVDALLLAEALLALGHRG